MRNFDMTKKKIEFSKDGFFRIKSVFDFEFIPDGTRIGFGERPYAALLDRHRTYNKEASLIVDDSGGSDISQEYLDNNLPCWAIA
jgi:hypothetical protein